MQSLRMLVPLAIALSLSAGSAYAASPVHRPSPPVSSTCATDVPQSLSPTTDEADGGHTGINDPKNINDNAYCRNGLPLYHMRNMTQQWATAPEPSGRAAPRAMY